MWETKNHASRRRNWALYRDTPVHGPRGQCAKKATLSCNRSGRFLMREPHQVDNYNYIFIINISIKEIILINLNKGIYKIILYFYIVITKYNKDSLIKYYKK